VRNVNLSSPLAIQMHNWQRTSSTEEKLDTKSQHEKGDQTVDICHNIRLAHGSICTICDNADRIKESAKSGTEVFVCVATLPQSYRNEWYQKLLEPLTLLLH
jgi:hypothetical protein